jgi:TPR repeat protein
MGSGGYLRNLTRAARLYEKLAQGGSRHGKIMAGICYFKGEGVPINRIKANEYFTDTSKDEISEYMLVAIKYFEIIERGTR